MDDVTANLDAVITTNGARLRGSRVSFTQHDTASLDDIQAFPDHSHNWGRGHVCNKAREELPLRQISIVLLQQLFTGL